jgi:hypothetical protein
VERNKFRQAVLDRIESGTSKVAEDDIEGLAGVITGAVEKAIQDDAIVPKGRNRPAWFRRSRRLQDLETQLRLAKGAHKRAKTTESGAAVAQCEAELAKAYEEEKNRRRQRCRSRLERQTPRQTIHHLSKWAKHTFQPRMVRYMPGLRKDGSDTDMWLDNEEKVEACAQSIWTKEGVSREPREDSITCSSADADSMALAKKDEITPAEVHKILRHLSLRKAPDSTGASNEALRLLAAGEG